MCIPCESPNRRRSMSKFPKTMAALASVEGTIWDVADALVEEVVLNKDGTVRYGQFPAASKEAAAHGFVNPTSGQPYNPNYLATLHAVAEFVNDAHASMGIQLRKFPVQAVLEARKKNRTPEEALA